MPSTEASRGSAGMEALLMENKDLFACSTTVVVDGAFMKPDTPVIGTGSRGLVYAEVIVDGPARDLHSGNYGGIVHNPVQAAAEMAARLHDERCLVTIPGFYDHVRQFSQEEIQAARKLEPGAAHRLPDRTENQRTYRSDYGRHRRGVLLLRGAKNGRIP